VHDFGTLEPSLGAGHADLTWDTERRLGALRLAISDNKVTGDEVKRAFKNLGSPALSFNTTRGPVDGVAWEYELASGKVRIVFPDEHQTRVSAIIINRFPES
jgi:hypothetical protein